MRSPVISATQEGELAGQPPATSLKSLSTVNKAPAVNDTLYWRLITLSVWKSYNTWRLISNYLQKYLHLRHRSQIGRAHPITSDIVIKTLGDVRLEEAATMKFIAEKTSIPVPKVLSAFERKGQVFIVMERIQGTPLSAVFNAPSTSDEMRSTFLDQLREILKELRALPPPTAFSVGHCINAPLQDPRQHQDMNPVRFGPFATIQDFHRWLRNDMEFGQASMPNKQDVDEFNSMIQKQDGPWPPSVFTHGDLNPSNIIVRDGKIVGIIDWEMAGWYPHYWEYTANKMQSNQVNPDWYNALEKVLEPYPEELKMEQTRFYWFGQLL